MAPASPSRKEAKIAETSSKPSTAEVIDIDDSDEPSPVKNAPANGSKGKQREISPAAHQAEAIGVGKPADGDDGNASDTGSFQSDSMDPAMSDAAILDEEEGMHAEGSGGAGAGDGAKKPGFQGGYNAMKTFNGQYYSGMGIGMSHTW